MLPRARITEVLGEVDGWTGFADRFTHLRTGNPAADKPALLAGVLADGTNLGLARMADASRGVSYHHLVNVAQWHISDDNYVAARAAMPPAGRASLKEDVMSAIRERGDLNSRDPLDLVAEGMWALAAGKACPECWAMLATQQKEWWRICANKAVSEWMNKVNTCSWPYG